MKILSSLFALSLTLICSSQIALALPKHCLEGSKSERWVQARAAVATLRGSGDFSSVEAITKNGTIPLDHVVSKLGEYADAHGCEFGNHAQFENDYDLVKSVANRFWIKKSDKPLPSWLKPGFKAVLSGFDSNNSVFIEMNEDGFVFHDCEGNDGEHTGEVPHPSEKCPAMFNSAVFVPANQMLDDSVGAKHAVLMSLKIIAEVGIVALSVFDAGIATSGANFVNSIFGPQPLMDAQKLYSGERTIKDLIKMEKIAKEGTVVTRILPFTWEELKGSITQMVQDIFKADYRQLNKIDHSPKNPKNDGKHYPGLLMQQRYHQTVNDGYSADHPVTTPSTTP